MPSDRNRLPDEEQISAQRARAVQDETVIAPGGLLHLQQLVGNRAVAALLSRETTAPQPTGERPVAAAVAPPQAEGYRSPALQLRSRLRGAALARRPLLRAPITTVNGGDWETTQYDPKQNVDSSGAALPAAVGMRGVDITVKFTPGGTVDAESIGLSQTAQSIVSGTPSLLPHHAGRAIGAADAKVIGSGPGETDESTHIDRAGGYNNPIYPVNNPNSTSLADQSTSAGWGQLGYHYTDKGAPKDKPATLIDRPRMPHADKDSRQVFETTAVATKGAQAGTYYGSVRWGWHTDSAGNLTQIPLTKVSDGVPSSSFMKSAELWNPSSSTTGAANVELPLVDVQVTNAQVSLVRPGPLPALALPVGTRLQVLQAWHPPLSGGQVKVVDGPNTGQTGEVAYTEWGSIVDERS
jgi:hypothetical protein